MKGIARRLEGAQAAESVLRAVDRGPVFLQACQKEGLAGLQAAWLECDAGAFEEPGDASCGILPGVLLFRGRAGALQTLELSKFGFGFLTGLARRRLKHVYEGDVRMAGALVRHQPRGRKHRKNARQENASEIFH